MRNFKFAMLLSFKLKINHLPMTGAASGEQSLLWLSRVVTVFDVSQWFANCLPIACKLFANDRSSECRDTCSHDVYAES